MSQLLQLVTGTTRPAGTQPDLSGPGPRFHAAKTRSPQVVKAARPPSDWGFRFSA